MVFGSTVTAFNSGADGALTAVHSSAIFWAKEAEAAQHITTVNVVERNSRPITFIVISFTSVVSGMRFNVVPAPGTPRYDGIMLRTAMWEQLEMGAHVRTFGRRPGT